jgi:iron complex outermembrane recepter protein
MKRLFCFFLLTGLTFIVRATDQEGTVPVIRGRVTDTVGNPLHGATVTIQNTFLGSHTDTAGYYSFKNLKKGTYILRASFVGYESRIAEAVLNKDITVNFSLSLKTFVTGEAFVSATRAGEQTPLAFSTVDQEAISKNNTAQDIPYLLNYTPSLVVSSDAGTGVGYTTINIRGTDVKRINVTIDGIPVNDAESHGVWWVDLPDLASSAENIQIQRGVGTSTNGAGAFGATINFQTVNPGKEPYAEINSSYGSFNTSKNTINFGTGLINNMFAIDARLSKIWSDGYIDRAFSDLNSFYISGTMYRKSGILKLLIFSGEEHTYQAWYGVPKDSLKTNRTYNPYSYKNETDNYWQDNYQLHYSKDMGSHLHADLALHYTKGRGYYENYKHDYKFSAFNLPAAIFPGDTVYRSDFIAQKWLVNDFYGFTYSFTYRKDKINTVIGGGWNNYSGEHFGDIIWARIVTFDGEKYRWYNGTGIKKDLNNYIKVNYLIADKLSLYADLQLRNINYKIAGIDDNLKDITQKHLYNFFNPKAGLLYNPDEKQKIYASFGVSHREPDRSNFTDADYGKIPGPEKLFDYEAGYEFHTSKFMFGAGIYYMNYIDQLISTGEINNVGDPVMTNVPESFRQGIELEASLKICSNFSWYGNITFSRNIIPEFTDYTDNWDTWSQEKETLKNRTISFSPSVIAGSTIDYEPLNDFHITLNTKFVGKQYIDNTQNPDRMLNSYLVNNLSCMYKIKTRLFRELTIRFAVNNLFNNLYETNAWVYKYFEGGALHVSDGYFPQAGINCMVRAGIKF